jgi:glutathione S-transferase
METNELSSQGALKLYAARYCPFAQRAWMGLLHKGLAFEYKEVDPYRESQWWLDISHGRAKVPVLVTPAAPDGHSTTVIDSTRFVEFIEDLAPYVNPLFPVDASERAETRFWIDHINERVVPYVYRFLQAKKPGKYRDKSREKLTEGVEALAAVMSPSGPYISGTAVTVLDLLLIPFAYRIDVLLGHYRDFSLPTSGPTWERYQEWYQAMCATEIFRATATNHADYRERLIEFYLPYSQGGGQKDVTRVP